MFTKENIQLVKGFIQFLVGIALIVYGLTAGGLDPQAKSAVLNMGMIFASVEIAGHVVSKVVEKKK